VSLNIKNQETHRLAREIAELTGESLAATVTVAVRERLDRVRRQRGAGLADRLLALGKDCAKAVEKAASRRISAGNFLEAGIVIDASRDPIAFRRLDDLLGAADITIEPATGDQARIGRKAYRDFGKGSAHPAQLTFGDYFAYALAKVTGEPLLFKGADFTHTDLAPAI